MTKDVYHGLIDQIFTVDIKRRDTWSTIKELYAKCTFVTCTTLLIAIGYRDLTAWCNKSGRRINITTPP